MYKIIDNPVFANECLWPLLHWSIPRKYPIQEIPSIKASEAILYNLKWADRSCRLTSKWEFVLAKPMLPKSKYVSRAN